MCRSSEEIRRSDYTCIALDEYISHRKKSVNGDKESLAYFDVLRSEAEIQNRIVTLQTQEDMLDKFDKTQKELVKIGKKTTDCKTEIGVVDGKIEAHLVECKLNPTLKKSIKENPGKVFIHITLVFLIYFIFFHLLSYWVGFDTLLKGLVNMIPGVDI